MLSDIVKRRSIQVLCVTARSRTARYLHLGIGSRWLVIRNVFWRLASGVRYLKLSAKLDRLAVGSIL